MAQQTHTHMLTGQAGSCTMLAELDKQRSCFIHNDTLCCITAEGPAVSTIRILSNTHTVMREVSGMQCTRELDSHIVHCQFRTFCISAITL